MIDAIADFLRALPKGKPFLVAAHVRPDGDAAGAVFGFVSALRDNGYEAEALFPGLMPDGYGELLDPQGYHTEPEKVTFENYAMLFALDTSNPERLDIGRPVETLPIPVVVIDHHADNKKYGAHNFVMSAPSASDIVYRAVAAAGWKVSPYAATAFLSGLVRDTGCFRFANTDPVAFECAAALLRAGADYPMMIDTLYFQRPLNEMQCNAELIARHLTFHDNDTIAILFADPVVFGHYQLELTNTDALIDEIRAIRGVEIVVLYYLVGTKYKISFRSKRRERPVGDVARALGGGGHDMAASCVIEAPDADGAVQRILEEILKK